MGDEIEAVQSVAMTGLDPTNLYRSQSGYALRVDSSANTNLVETVTTSDGNTWRYGPPETARWLPPPSGPVGGALPWSPPIPVPPPDDPLLGYIDGRAMRTIYEQQKAEAEAQQRMQREAERQRAYLAKKEKEERMWGLFKVYVVEVKTSTVLHEVTLVAKDVETAKISAARRLPEGADLEDYDIVVALIGNVRPRPAKAKPQEVRVIP